MPAKKTAIANPPRAPLTLEFLEGAFAVSRMEPDAAVPDWAATARWFSISRTADELSVVCPVESVPAGVTAVSPWAMFRVAGALDFDEIGVLAGLSRALADADISVFVVSTFDTDYVLVRESDAANARTCLKLAGHKWTNEHPP